MKNFRTMAVAVLAGVFLLAGQCLSRAAEESPWPSPPLPPGVTPLPAAKQPATPPATPPPATPPAATLTPLPSPTPWPSPWTSPWPSAEPIPTALPPVSPTPAATPTAPASPAPTAAPTATAAPSATPGAGLPLPPEAQGVEWSGPESAVANQEGQRDYQILGLMVNPEPRPLPVTVGWPEIDDLPFSGIEVLEVAPGSVAAQLGLLPHDLIFRINGRATDTIPDLLEGMIESDYGVQFRLEIIRAQGRGDLTPVNRAYLISFNLPSVNNESFGLPAPACPFIFEARSNEFFEEVNLFHFLYRVRKSRDYKSYRLNPFWQQWAYGTYFEVRLFWLPIYSLRAKVPIFL